MITEFAWTHYTLLEKNDIIPSKVNKGSVNLNTSRYVNLFITMPSSWCVVAVTLSKQCLSISNVYLVYTNVASWPFKAGLVYEIE